MFFFFLVIKSEKIVFYKNLSFLEVFYGLFNIVKFGGYLVIVIKEIYGKKKL